MGRRRAVDVVFTVVVVALGLVAVGGLAGVAVSAEPHGPGREVFIDAGCGACHTLRDAGTSGQRAPDLDVVDPSRDHVSLFVQSGGVGMPPFAELLRQGQIDQVSDYVASVAGR